MKRIRKREDKKILKDELLKKKLWLFYTVAGRGMLGTLRGGKAD